jgi:hypothetical protein
VDDREFLKRFEAAAISSEDWRHRDHVRMAFLYLRDAPFDTAVTAIRRGIQALNLANDVPEGPVMGYHETATVAWARIVVATIAAHGPVESSQAFLDANPHLLSRTLLRLYYSRDRILSPEAKADFVSPDLAPLPAVPGPGPAGGD